MDLEIPRYVYLVLITVITLGLGMSMMKYGVPKLHPGQKEKKKTTKKQKIFWLVGLGLSLVGIACNAKALQEGPISVVQPIYTLHVLVVMFMGTRFLGEQITLKEWLASLIMIVGASLVAFGPQAEQLNRYNLGSVYGMFAISITLILLTLIVVKTAKSAKTNEKLLGIAAGIFFGTTIVCFKLATVKAGGSEMTTDDIGKIFNIWILLAGITQILGLGIINLAFTQGRASIIIPLKTMSLTLYPVLGGIAIFGEYATLPKIAGVFCILLATLGLVRD
ncbi:MAG TPA: EamA family transporter [Bdellovibrionota bacterium]|nr:EamA family transporter [Bdellovibrionota bacterium]